ncbi:MAG: Rpn family recombination-promoting nuclease/putative transposase [Gracilibacteraceae bacterium]|jgi:predicted transposase/invertase (TIGR01784 family)|nr:Rpn family recombination-promoting nuclease/putative transposase [Gracilibacteraceae bacterium]
MSEKVYLPTNDLLFKKMLTDKGNDDIAAGFINDLFNVYVEVTPLVPYDVQAMYDALKESKLIKTEVDFLCETHLGERFIIELQVAEQQNFSARALYYLCSRFCSTYNTSGLVYDDLKAIN